MTRLLSRAPAKDTLLLCLDAVSSVPASDNDGDGAIVETGPAARRPRDSWSARAARLLEHARQEGWSVGHVISRRPRVGQLAWRPVAGMAPSPSEPVYHREEPSAFSSLELCEALQRGPRGEVVLCGVSIQGSCLATALDALQMKLRLTVATNAVLMSAPERTGLEGFLRLQSLGLAQSAVRMTSSEGLAPAWQGLRVVQGGRA